MSFIDFSDIIDVFTISVLVALSVYHFIVYRGRIIHTEERYNFYFSIFSFSVALFLFIGSPMLIYRTKIGTIYGDFFPPAEGLILLVIFYSFTNFFSSLLKFPDEQKRLLKLGYYFLAVSLSITIISLFKGYVWYNLNLFPVVVGLAALYILFISYLYVRWIFINKIYKERIIKIVIAGIFILIFYLLISKIIAFFNVPQILRRNNLVTTGVLYMFASALATKFNREFDELVLLKNNLEQKILERTIELTKAKEQIEIVSKEKSDFFINLAHETKTPLTIISNYLDRYINKHGVAEEIDIIKRNIDKLCKDMVDFLDMEKLIKGSISYENNQLSDISKLLTDKISLFREYAGEKNIKLFSEITTNLFIKADPYLIDRIVFNLIENAIKYTPVGGEINIKLSNYGNELIFTVSDTGIGIPEVQLDHIFEPYYQISHKKLNSQGMGMGLYVVKRSVEMLNGSINVDSIENKGSVFTVKLPLYVPSPDEIPSTFVQMRPVVSVPKITEKDIDPQKPNILLVEDNIDMINYLIEELSNCYNVFPVKNGIEALKKINNMPSPELIISDIMMDQMDGEEFFNKISISSQYKNIPFIFLTAKTQQDEKIKMLLSGVVDYIYKPFAIEELKAKVKTIIQNADKQKKEGLKQAIDIITKQLNDPEKPVPDKRLTFEEKCRQHELTGRQKEIVLLVAEGFEYKEIAGKLNISYKTVTRHIENLFEKLDVHNKVDLINKLYRD